MSEWIHSTVGEVTVYQRAGGTPTATTDSFYGGEIPFVTIEDITNGTRFLDRTEKNLSESGLSNSAAWLIKEPHILYSMYATVGKPIINRISCATNQAIIALKESEKIEQTFLFYQLLFIRPDVYKFTSQTTQSNLNAGSVKKLPISYPRNKCEQRKIAAILTSIDTAIEKTEALIEKYQQIKAGLMHDLFTRGVLPNGQLRPSRDQAPELYQETAIGWIPKDWKLGLFGDYVSIIDPNPSHRYPPEVDEGIPICSTENFVDEDFFDFSKSKFVPAKTFIEQNNRCQFKESDVIFARKGKIGLGRRYGSEQKVFSHTVVILKPKSDSLEPLWLLWAVRSFWFLAAIDRTMNSNSGVPTLGVDFISKISMPFPSLSEQALCAQRLDQISTFLTQQKQSLLKLQNKKKGLMQDLLTGKVPVKIELHTSSATESTT